MSAQVAGSRGVNEARSPLGAAAADGVLSPRGGGCRRAGGRRWGPAPSGAVASCAGDVPPSAGGRSPAFTWRRFAGAPGPWLGRGELREESVRGGAGEAAASLAVGCARPGGTALECCFSLCSLEPCGGAGQVSALSF